MSTTNQVYRHTIKGSLSGLKQLNEDVPQPLAHEVLVEIKAVSLNYRDLAISKGTYPFSVKEDDLVPCSDMAGQVVNVGKNVIGFKTGDRVTCNFDPYHLYGPASTWESGLGGPIDGVLRRYATFPYTSLLHVPSHLTYEEAACLPCTGVTAWNALYGGVPIVAGQSVLLQGTGGVSMIGLMLAQAAGALTIITSSSDEKLKLAKKLGATHTINYKTDPDWDKKALELTGGAGVDFIFDNIGVAGIENALNCIAPGGQIGCIGILGGTEPKDTSNIPLMVLGKNASIRGVQIGSHQQFSHLNRFMAARQLHPLIDRVFLFEEAKQALEYMESQKHVGKIVIKL